MRKHKQLISSLAGLAGTFICFGLFISKPSFPTPDKLIIFLFFIFLIFNQARQMLVRLGPFVILLLVYESFRGLAHHLNNHVHYTLGPRMDQIFFGRLPTKILQDWLWKGHTSWYDIMLYVPYLLFFVVPLGLAIIVWKTRERYYWQVVATYLAVFFAAFLTFLAYPSAPPWLASQNHYIEPVVRTSTNVWYSLGIHDFPSVYNHISPNPVAAIPSLHAACATLLSLFAFRLYGRRWGLISLIYPALIYVGVVYEAEHYVFDVAMGIIYAAVGFWLTPHFIRVLPAYHKRKLHAGLARAAKAR